MLKEELFKELTVDNVELNGDINLTEVGLIWSLKFEAPELEENEGNLDVQEELVEAFEEDFDFIKDLIEFYNEDMNEIEVGELLIEDDFLFVELITEELN